MPKYRRFRRAVRRRHKSEGTPVAMTAGIAYEAYRTANAVMKETGQHRVDMITEQWTGRFKNDGGQVNWQAVKDTYTPIVAGFLISEFGPKVPIVGPKVQRAIRRYTKGKVRM